MLEKEYIEENYGIECVDYAKGCPICDIWREYYISKGEYTPNDADFILSVVDKYARNGNISDIIEAPKPEQYAIGEIQEMLLSRQKNNDESDGVEITRITKLVDGYLIRYYDYQDVEVIYEVTIKKLLGQIVLI